MKSFLSFPCPRFRCLIVHVIILLGGLWFAGCGAPGSSDGGGSAESEEAVASGVFDLRDAGMRGMSYNQGKALLLNKGLSFEVETLELSTIQFSLITQPRDMSDLQNPPVEFQGEPVAMRLRISGLIQDHAPGRIDVDIESVRPLFGGGTGSSDEEKLIEDLAANGVALPEASSSSPIPIRLEVSSGDEENQTLVLRSDVNWLERVEAEEGEKAGY